MRQLSQNGLWRSLVTRYTGGVEIAGSNPVSPTSSNAVNPCDCGVWILSLRP